MPPKRPKNFDTLQDYLRELRLALEWTQDDVAELSRDRLVSFNRNFVAGLEARGLPGTVAKFFSVLRVLGADLQLAQELAEIHLVETDGQKRYLRAADLCSDATAPRAKSVALAAGTLCRTLDGEDGYDGVLAEARTLAKESGAIHTRAVVEYFTGRTLDLLEKGGLAQAAYLRCRALGEILGNARYRFESDLRLCRLALQHRHRQRLLDAFGLDLKQLICLRHRLIFDREDEALYAEIEATL